MHVENTGRNLLTHLSKVWLSLFLVKTNAFVKKNLYILIQKQQMHLAITYYKPTEKNESVERDTLLLFLWNLCP